MKYKLNYVDWQDLHPHCKDYLFMEDISYESFTSELRMDFDGIPDVFTILNAVLAEFKSDDWYII